MLDNLGLCEGSLNPCSVFSEVLLFDTVVFVEMCPSAQRVLQACWPKAWLFTQMGEFVTGYNMARLCGKILNMAGHQPIEWVVCAGALCTCHLKAWCRGQHSKASVVGLQQFIVVGVVETQLCHYRIDSLFENLLQGMDRSSNKFSEELFCLQLWIAILTAVTPLNRFRVRMASWLASLDAQRLLIRQRIFTLSEILEPGWGLFCPTRPQRLDSLLRPTSQPSDSMVVISSGQYRWGQLISSRKN